MQRPRCSMKPPKIWRLTWPIVRRGPTVTWVTGNRPCRLRYGCPHNSRRSPSNASLSFSRTGQARSRSKGTYHDKHSPPGHTPIFPIQPPFSETGSGSGQALPAPRPCAVVIRERAKAQLPGPPSFNYLLPSAGEQAFVRPCCRPLPSTCSVTHRGADSKSSTKLF